MKPSRSEFITVRGLQYHLRHWGDQDRPLLLMLHGWMDVSASFQFVVDCLRREWHVVSPDWRGFGRTAWPATDTYYFADYLGDLDAIVRHVSPHEPVNLVGHSMGGNVACLYAGVRPGLIRRLVNLEGFGTRALPASEAPDRYAKWLDELREPATLRGYESLERVAMRLQKNNRRLTAGRAAFLAGHWAAQDGSGQWQIQGDPVHKQASPILYRVEEVLACWQRISAPTLWVEADDTNAWDWMGPKEEARKEIDRRVAHIRDVRTALVRDAGHMLHHDQPEEVAALIENFLG